MSSDLQILTGTEESKKDSAIAKIESDLAAVRDGQNKERFAGLVLIIALVDMIAFRDIAWGPALFIGFLEIIFILVVAECLGVDRVYTIITNAADIVNKLRGNKDVTGA